MPDRAGLWLATPWSFGVSEFEGRLLKVQGVAAEAAQDVLAQGAYPFSFTAGDIGHGDVQRREGHGSAADFYWNGFPAGDFLHGRAADARVTGLATVKPGQHFRVARGEQ
jgi:hypothetical protein